MAMRKQVLFVICLAVLAITVPAVISCNSPTESTNPSNAPQSTGTLETFPLLQKPPTYEPLRTLKVEQTIQHGEVSITVRALQFFDDKMAILYQTSAPENIIFLPFSRSDPTIECGGEVINTLELRHKLAAVEDINYLWYPPLPKDTSEFTLHFPPFSTNTGPAADFSIYLGDQVGYETPPDKGRELQIDQVIEFESAQFRIISFVLYPESFRFTYQPEPGSEATGIFLLLPGPSHGSISAADDRGNTYDTYGGGGLTLDWVEDEPQLKEQTISFEGGLEPGTTRLDVHIPATGVSGTEPFRFKIQIK